MDQSERLVEQYLELIGFTDIVYEPAGNRPPDFLVDKRIAIEVRRLNQNFNDGVRTRGLEEDEIPLWANMRRYLHDLSVNASHNRSWFVFFSFRRPIPSWRILRRELDGLLKPFKASDDPQPFSSEVATNFEIEVSPSSLVDKPLFMLGGADDYDSGGWVLHEISTNLQLCVSEKARKVARYRSEYPEWWLVLPIHIFFDASDFEELLYKEEFTLDAGGFDKIILLDIRNGSRAFQFHPKPRPLQSERSADHRD